MGQFITTGSTNMIAGDDVYLTIKISQKDPSFQLSGKLKVYNVFDILDEKATPSVEFKKLDTILKFSYSENYYYKTNSNLKVTSFDIIIKGKRNPNFQSSATLKIEIPTQQGEPETILFEVQKNDKPIAIQEFKASSTIIQKSKQELVLSYKIDGEGVDVKLLENAKLLDCDLSKSISFDGKPSGLYEYTLEATKGSQTVSKSINVLYVEETIIKKRAVPIGKTIVNFCIAQEENYLYALMYAEKEDIFEIYFTEQIDGENTWSIIKITDQETIRLFATSPMLHLQSDNEKKAGKLGQLYFICGSRVGQLGEPDKVANQVAIINLDDEGDNIRIHCPMKLLSKDDSNPKKLPAKFGHTCILFPKGTDRNTIWMLGGQDKYGEASNEILTSPDGLTWTVRDNPPSSWSARSMLSMAVSWKYDGNERIKDALWLVGGFHDFAGFGGGFKNDVWRFYENKWEKVNLGTEPIPPKSLACGIAYSGLEDMSNTGLVVLGNTNDKGEKTYFLKLNKNSTNDYVLNDAKPGLSITHFNQGVYITGFFRECMWVMGVDNTALEGVTYSSLEYRIPTIHQKTIKLYNKE